MFLIGGKSRTEEFFTKVHYEGTKESNQTLRVSRREKPGIRKPLLQGAMRGILPEAIRTRRFQPSFNDIYWTGLQQNLPHLEEMVDRSQIDELGIFDKQQLIQVMLQHAVGIGDARSGNRINTSLALIAWFDQTQKVLQKLPDQPTTTHPISPSKLASC